MAKKSYEGGEWDGLAWFDGEVVRIVPSDPALRVPQVGWNQLRYRKASPLFAGIPAEADFYFVHSFAMQCRDENDVDATTDYGGAITAAIRKRNIFATQFHPEKSQDYGLKVLENFLNWKP